MTFFYDLNKKLATLAEKQESQQLSESAVAERATGDYSAKDARAGKDIGKPGKGFAKIAKSAGEKYGSKERGEKVAGAVLAKLRGKNEGIEQEGNAFSGAVAKAKADGVQPGEKIKVGGKEYPVREGEVPAEFRGAKKSDVPAYQRKAKGGDWKVGQKDLDKERERNISDRKGLARLRGADPAEVDEGWDDMLKMVKDRGDMKVGDTKKGAKGTITKTATGVRHTRSYDEKTGETDTGDDAPAAGEKRGRGRPKKYTADNPRQERTTAKSRKADRTAYSKKKVNEYGDFGPMEDQDEMVDRGEYDREGDMAKEQLHTIEAAAEELHAILSDEENLPEWVQSKITKAMDYIDTARDYMKSSKADDAEPVAEKAPPGAKAERMVKHIKKGYAKDGKLTDKEKSIAYATAWKSKNKSKKKEKEVEENTVAGNVAPADEAPKSKGSGGFTFGKGIYDSLNRELETMISESMNISMNMSNNPDGGPAHSLTVTATDEDALKLATMLKMAGLGGGEQEGPATCETCNEAPCHCAEMVDENQPEWPTDQVEAEDNFEYSGGLNGPKSTGQTTGAPFNRQPQRQGAMAEQDELAGMLGFDGQPSFNSKEINEQEQDELSRMKEMAGIRESAKPDYVDLDKDGNKKESMKKAADDKAKGEKKVEESILSLTNLWKEYKGQ